MEASTYCREHVTRAQGVTQMEVGPLFFSSTVLDPECTELYTARARDWAATPDIAGTGRGAFRRGG